MAIDLDLFPGFKQSLEANPENGAEISHTMKDGSGLIEVGDDHNDNDKKQRAVPDDGSTSGQEGEEDPDREQSDSSSSDNQGGRSDGTRKAKKEASGRLQKRFDELTYANRMMAAQLEEANRQNSLLQQERSKKLEEVRKENQTLRNHTLEIERDRTIQALEAVNEAGDYRLQAELQEKLARINAAKVQMEMEPRQTERYVSPPPPLNQSYAPPTYQQMKAAEGLQRWKERTDWANEATPSYNRDMALQAADVFDALDREYDLHGMGADKYGDEYFNVAQKAINNMWGRGDVDDAPQSQQKQGRPASVAPVARAGGNMAEQYMASGGDNARKYGTTVDPRLLKAWRNTTIPVSPNKQIQGNESLEFITAEKLRQMKNNRR